MRCHAFDDFIWSNILFLRREMPSGDSSVALRWGCGREGAELTSISSLLVCAWTRTAGPESRVFASFLVTGKSGRRIGFGLAAFGLAIGGASGPSGSWETITLFDTDPWRTMERVPSPLSLNSQCLWELFWASQRWTCRHSSSEGTAGQRDLSNSRRSGQQRESLP